MINVNFTSESGETTYSYSWQNCGGNKNVNFELENPSYTWCTVTHTPENSKVKIHADAVPARQRDPRNAKVLMKVNDVTCDEFFYVSQPGQPCGCSAFAPIEIGATFPSSGAAVGTVIGSYYNDTTCDASKITITGDLQAGAVGGQIKLTSAVGSYNDGRTFNVIFNYNGSECTRGTCTQSAASCRCTTITATTYTFAPDHRCGSISPVTVLKIDDCCSIVTGITGDDYDKFTVSVGGDLSAGEKMVSVCPKSENMDEVDRTALISVTATCGNETCYSSVTVTQAHTAYTPSCSCGQFTNAVITGITYPIASSGIGSTYQTLWEAYVSSKVCVNACSIDTTPSSYPPSQLIPEESITSVTDSTYDGVSCKKITLSAKKMPANERGGINTLLYTLSVNNKACSIILIDQKSQIPCSCEYFVSDGLVRQLVTALPKSGTTELVMIGSGNTHGCGELIANPQTPNIMINSFSAQTKEIEIEIGGEMVVVDKNYYWWALFNDISSSVIGDANCSIFFKYFDRDGVEQTCNEHFEITQTDDLCDCPTFASETNSLAISGRAYGSYDDPIDPARITPETIGTLNYSWERYDSMSNAMCQFVAAESNVSWCKAYANYNGSSTNLEIVAERNTSTSARTAIVTFTGISNIRKNNGTLGLITRNYYYHYCKEYLDANGKYDTCGNVIKYYITQEPFGACDCENSGFEMRTYENPTAYCRSTSYSWEFNTNLCGEATFESTYVNASGQPTSYDWVWNSRIEDVGTNIKKFTAYYNENGSDKERTFYVRLTMNLIGDGGATYTCNKLLSLTQGSACGCECIFLTRDTVEVSYDGGTINIPIANTICATADKINATFDGQYSWMRGITAFESGGITYISVIVDYSNQTTDRRGYINVTIQGTDCSSNSITIKQEKNSCAYCEAISGDILTAHIIAYAANTTESKPIASPRWSSCDRVEKLDYSKVDTGYGTGWFNITTNVYNRALEVSCDNNTGVERVAKVMIIPKDSINQPTIDGCEIECIIKQLGASSDCDCTKMSNDDNYLHIEATPLSDGTYYIAPGSTLYLGYIQLDSDLAPCLSYIATNAQPGAARMTISQRTGGRTTFDIYVTATSTATDTAGCTLTRADISKDRGCWSKGFTFKFRTD